MILKPILLQRFGLWALLQALPNESTLKRYVRAVYLGLCSAIIGSILFGALVTAGGILLQQALVMSGFTDNQALLATIAIGFALLGGCIWLSISAAKNLVTLKQYEVKNPVDNGSDLGANRLFRALRDGFIEGYFRNKNV